jgi:hypothetical protein
MTRSRVRFSSPVPATFVPRGNPKIAPIIEFRGDATPAGALARQESLWAEKLHSHSQGIVLAVLEFLELFLGKRVLSQLHADDRGCRHRIAFEQGAVKTSCQQVRGCHAISRSSNLGLCVISISPSSHTGVKMNNSLTKFLVDRTIRISHGNASNLGRVGKERAASAL